MVFHNQNSYSTTLTSLRGTHDISITSNYRPLHSPVRQAFSYHSNRVCIIDFRPIGDTTHLWATFVGFFLYGHSQPTSPGFTRLGFRYMTRAGVLKGVFLGVTPSFRSLGYAVLDCIFVLSRKHFSCLNKSRSDTGWSGCRAGLPCAHASPPYG